MGGAVSRPSSCHLRICRRNFGQENGREGWPLIDFASPREGRDQWEENSSTEVVSSVSMELWQAAPWKVQTVPAVEF